MNRVSALIVVAVAMLIASGKAQETITKYSDIKTQAARLDKPILIEFYAAWSPTCNDFESALESDISTQKALEAVVLYQADVEKGDGKSLAKEFKVKVYPSFIMVNAEGEPLDRWFGYDKDNFVAIFTDALKEKSTISQIEERLEKTPTIEDAAALGRWYLAYGECKKAARYYREAQKLNSDPDNDYSYEIFMSVACGELKKEYSFDDVKQAADEVMRSKNELKPEVYDASQRMVTLALDNNRKDLIAGYIKGGLNATSDTTDSDMIADHDQLMVIKMLFIDGDTAKAIGYEKASMPKDWMNNAVQLNDFAQWCLGAHVDLPEGEAMAQKAVTLAHPGKEKAKYYDTLADICHVEGNKTAAVDYTKMAITEDPDNEDYPIQLSYYEALEKTK